MGRWFDQMIFPKKERPVVLPNLDDSVKFRGMQQAV